MKLELHDPYSSHAASLWRSFESSTSSFFVSWPWIENWLSSIPRAKAPHLAVLSEAGVPVAACFLGRRFHVRNRIVPTRAMFLNTTGNARFDSVCIEYNGLVGADVPLATLVEALPSGWDELFLPGLPDAALGGIERASLRGDYRVRIDRKVPVYFVRLGDVRDRDYLALLSSGTRNQVRRARREAGETSIEVATDVEQARDIYAELCALHNASWNAKGQPGAFSDPWFVDLHWRFIEQRIAHGEIQLLRVRTKRETIGCLYNFVHRGRVLQYQSGFAMFSDPHLKPGFICHAAAIEHSAAQGLDVYDFLGGAARYKKSLSTDVGSLSWARVQRQRLRFVVEEQLRRLRGLVWSPGPAAHV